MSKIHCIASIDVGQTYFATCVLTRETPASSSSKFTLSHLAIDEFVAGSAPHQPVYASLQTEHQAQMAKLKRKAMAANRSSGTNRKESGATVTLSEMDAVRKASELVRRIVYEFGVQLLLVEDQLPNVRRNRLIQATIVSACVAMDVMVLSVAPPAKFNFASIPLQKLVAKSRESRKDGPKSLKSLSRDIYMDLVKEHAEHQKSSLDNDPLLPALDSYSMDLGMIDPESAFGQDNFSKTYMTVADWYKKDLTDAFWQAVCGLRMCNDSRGGVSGTNAVVTD